MSLTNISIFYFYFHEKFHILGDLILRIYTCLITSFITRVCWNKSILVSCKFYFLYSIYCTIRAWLVYRTELTILTNNVWHVVSIGSYMIICTIYRFWIINIYEVKIIYCGKFLNKCVKVKHVSKKGLKSVTK